MCISYLTFSDLMTHVIITSEILGELLTVKISCALHHKIACNLIWWAVLGSKMSWKKQEIVETRGKRQRHWENKKKYNKNRHVLWRFLVAIFHYKIGEFAP